MTALHWDVLDERQFQNTIPVKWNFNENSSIICLHTFYKWHDTKLLDKTWKSNELTDVVLTWYLYFWQSTKWLWVWYLILGKIIVFEINLWFVDIKDGNMKRLNSQVRCIIINSHQNYFMTGKIKQKSSTAGTLCN